MREWKKDLVFLHEVVPGAAKGSYGLAVARLAGLPERATRRAAEVLKTLETTRDKTGGIAAGLSDLPLFAEPRVDADGADALRERLDDVRPDELTPRAALDLLYELKRLAVET